MIFRRLKARPEGVSRSGRSGPVILPVRGVLALGVGSRGRSAGGSGCDSGDSIVSGHFRRCGRRPSSYRPGRGSRRAGGCSTTRRAGGLTGNTNHVRDGRHALLFSSGLASRESAVACDVRGRRGDTRSRFYDVLGCIGAKAREDFSGAFDAERRSYSAFGIRASHRITKKGACFRVARSCPRSSPIAISRRRRSGWACPAKDAVRRERRTGLVSNCDFRPLMLVERSEPS